MVGVMERIMGDSWTWSYLVILLMISSAIGLTTLTRLLATFVQWIYVYFLRRPKNLRSYGTWAVVTGATDGIGKAFAIELSKQGFNMILIGRSSTKLSSVSSEILQSVSTRPCKITKLTLDFSSDEDLVNCVELVRKSTAGLDVGVLVNNAGTTYPHGMYFHEVSEDLWKDIVKVNVVGLTMMVQAVLPGMLERKKGAIINVGSAAAVAVPSFPLFTIYAATKT